MLHPRRNAGFTTKELVITTAVIAVLATIGNYFLEAAIVKWHTPKHKVIGLMPKTNQSSNEPKL